MKRRLSKFLLATRLPLGLFIVTMASTINALEYGVFGDVIIQEAEPYIRDDSVIELDLSLFLANEFTDRISSLAEVTLTDIFDDPKLEFERYWLGYEFNDQFKISLGRFHRPLGYWNRTYHHGTLLHDTVGRPFFLEFHEGVSATLSMHVTGAMATGNLSVQNGNIGYELALGNASGLDSTPPAPAGGHHHRGVEELQVDTLEDGISMALRLNFTPWSNHYHFGVFAMHQDILEEGEVADGALVPHGQVLMEQTVIGTDFRYRQDDFEFIGEYFHYIHHDQPGIAVDPSAHAFYLQLTYSPRPSWKTIYRFASLNLEQQDIYFQRLGASEQDRHVFALRYDINEFHNIKAEVEYVQSPVVRLDDTASLMLQWSFLLR